ncbi:MAG: peptide chain release factor 2 [Candidatus Omnitrophota bacterium]|nr:MAG: peptide chain release factor 2 [Candidatus Omnitrophota bacterium]
MLEDIKLELEKLEKRLNTLEAIFDVRDCQKKIEKIEKDISKENFWKNREKANQSLKELKYLKQSIEPFVKSSFALNEIKELLTITEEGDASSLSHLKEELRNLKKEIDNFEFKSLLNKEEDGLSAIVSINAGAGGTESCDWVGMLYRMYNRWADKKKYAIHRIDYLPGEEAGIKNVTFIVKGQFAYGYLKSESGVHRLVRISPFDANKRRHTSFASVDVIPEIDENIKIDIKESDLKIDTFRAGGKGGQHVNVTDSAVRITHVPTKIVVQCQNERSQYKNKQTAMKVLKSRLYERELEVKKAELAKQYEKKKPIEWGSQIRSYVLHPYSLIKDHRTGFEMRNAQAVLNGSLDGFIEAYLKKMRKR